MYLNYPQILLYIQHIFSYYVTQFRVPMIWLKNNRISGD